MGSISTQINTAFRDFATDGVASSGPHEVIKSEVRAVGPIIEQALALASGGSAVSALYETQAALNADLAHAAGSLGLVYNDTDESKNDLYVKEGASGSGSWTNTGAFHAIAFGAVEASVGQAEAWAEGTLPGGAGTKSAKEWATEAFNYADALSFEAVAPMFVYGREIKFARASVSYGLGDAITVDGYHFAKYSIRGLGGITFERSLVDGFWEIDPSGMEFETINFTSGDKIDGAAQWYYQGQKVRRAFTAPNANGSLAASLIETEDGTIHIPKLATGEVASEDDGIIEPIKELVPIGDSLTAAGYADTVASTLGLQLATPSSVSNTDIGFTAGGGIGSQTAAQIAARFGAYGLTCTVSGNTLSSGANTLTAISLALLSRASDAAGSNRTLRATIRTVAGRAIKGLLRCVQQSGGEITFAAQAYRYTFTPDDGQTLGAVPATAILHIDDEGRRERIPLIWIGRNNVGTVDFATEVKARIAQIVAAYRPLVKKMVIIGVTNATDEPSGSANHTAIVALNAELAAMYPDFFCDLRPALNSGTGDDTPNPSNMTDAIHYNNTGRTVVAGVVSSFIQSKEWL